MSARRCLYDLESGVWENPWLLHPCLFLRPPGVSIATQPGRQDGFGGLLSQGRWVSLREMSPHEISNDAAV